MTDTQTVTEPVRSIPTRRRATEDPDRKSTIRKFRPDIEGLRAVAVVSVVLSHVGLLGFSGGYVGVDVFFVISGFLITRQLYTEIDVRHTLSFGAFYARRARRILPAATLVIIVTLAAFYRWGPPLRRHSVALDGLFSAFSGVNWRLAATKTDYFNAAQPPSPFQHFWSLAVEEQFYIFWPVLLLLVGVLVGRRFGRRPALLWTLFVIIGASLALSVATTNGTESWAYFGTQTRAWELAVGALLAITVDVWTRMRPALACQMSWLGLAMIITAVFVYDGRTTYPGIADALPVMGAAFVIAGGCPGWNRSGELVLRQRPMQFLGKVSYSWYLWHWPLLMILPMYLGHGLNQGEKWFVVFGSLALSVVSFYAVEQPFRRGKVFAAASWRGLLSGAVLVACSIVVAAVIAANSITASPAARVTALPKSIADTALVKAVRAGTTLRAVPSDLTPSLANALADHPNPSGCFVEYKQTAPPPLSQCTFGDKTAGRSILMVGDSHALSWFDVVKQYATQHHYRLVFYAKANCNAGQYLDQVIDQLNRAYTECDTWRDNVFSFAKTYKPTYVLMASAIRAVSVDPSGTVTSIQRFQTYGARVIYMEDTPNPKSVDQLGIPDCLSKHMSDARKCIVPRPEASQLEGIARSAENAAVVGAKARVINPTPWFCTATQCPAVINNILVYQDESHSTATYLRWVSPEYNKALTAALRS